MTHKKRTEVYSETFIKGYNDLISCELHRSENADVTKGIRHEIRMVSREVNGHRVGNEALIIKDIISGDEKRIDAISLQGGLKEILSEEIGGLGVVAVYDHGATRPISGKCANDMLWYYSDVLSCE